MRGWLGYYGIAEMDTLMKQWNEWLRRRIRMYIWKQWKKPKTRIANLKKLGMPEWQVYRNGNTVLSSIFRKNVSAKMKFCAGKSGEGAAKPRLFAL